MPQLTASSSIALQLEDVNDVIPLLVESSHCLDARIKDNGRSTRVSTKSFRIRIQTALTGAVANGAGTAPVTRWFGLAVALLPGRPTAGLRAELIMNE